MPRVAIPKRRIQRAFAPLVFRTHFQRERCLTPPPLPWNVTYPPHGDGKPADDAPAADVAPAAAIEGRPSANNAPPIKIKRPPGEPGRKGCRGFITKDVLDLPEGMYEDLLGEVHSLAAARLNLAHTISNQPQDKLTVICKELKQKYPILEEKFEDDWPARAIIQAFLKNTSAKHGTSR